MRTLRVLGVPFFRGSREPDALLWLAWVHQRFAIPEFANALQRMAISFWRV